MLKMPNTRNSIGFITVNLNNSDGLDRTIRSYNKLKEILPPEVRTELIVIDGGSNDSSIETIYSNTTSITKYISEQDDGIYDAMRKGVELASTNFICFMNAGDTIIPEGMLKLIESAQDANTAHSGRPFWNSKIREFPFARHCAPLLRMPNHQCMLIPRQFIIDHPFDQKFPIAADLDQKLELHRTGRLLYHNIPTTTCDGGGISRRIDGFQALTKRAKEQATVANKHYGPLLGAINYLLFIGWHWPKATRLHKKK